MTQPYESSEWDRPRVVVSAMTSLDGRITLRRGRLLMEEETSRKWRSLWPPSAETLHRTRGINGALLRAGLVDEIHLLVLPAAIGGLGTPTVFDGPELGDRESATKLRLLFAHVEADGMLSLRYAVVHEESGNR